MERAVPLGIPNISVGRLAGESSASLPLRADCTLPEAVCAWLAVFLIDVPDLGSICDCSIANSDMLAARQRRSAGPRDHPWNLTVDVDRWAAERTGSSLMVVLVPERCGRPHETRIGAQPTYFRTRHGQAQYSSTMFLLVCSEFFTASNALGCVGCVLRRSSIVKVAANRQSFAGSPQRSRASKTEAEDSLLA